MSDDKSEGAKGCLGCFGFIIVVTLVWTILSSSASQPSIAQTAKSTADAVRTQTTQLATAMPETADLPESYKGEMSRKLVRLERLMQDIELVDTPLTHVIPQAVNAGWIEAEQERARKPARVYTEIERMTPPAVAILTHSQIVASLYPCGLTSHHVVWYGYYFDTQDRRDALREYANCMAALGKAKRLVQ